MFDRLAADGSIGARKAAENFMTCNGADKPDMVNHPPHYTSGNIECIEAIKAALTPDEFRGYIKGNAIKYCWRERTKGGDESLRKAVWYLNRLTDGV